MTTLSDASWQPLLERIADGQCTPFLGAGASVPILPLGKELSEELAAEFDYPLKEDRTDLASVSQWLATTRDLPWVKNRVSKCICSRIAAKGKPQFGTPADIHGVLARLPLPMYLTTNYDTFMLEALQWAKDHGRPHISPSTEYCRWHRELRSDLPSLPNIEPSIKSPLVYHLHGRVDVPTSFVLTEEDYEDFNVELSVNKGLIPHRVMRAISDTALLFVGYALRDWNFRVLFRAVVKSVERNLRIKGVTVQLSRDEYTPAAQSYLQARFEQLKLDIFWGSCAEFADELERRWTS